MNKKYFFFFFVALFSASQAQINVVSAMVPQYTQGKNSTNNNRTPFWFWAKLGGLTPGATYHYFPALDSLNASATSNGAGNPYLVNMLTSNFRRSTGASMMSSAGYDSLTADVSGSAFAWFGVEPTANGRFTPGDTLYPKIMLNNGSGGTGVATRVLFSSYPVIVLNYGTTAGSSLQGSALYDSADVAFVPAKSFAALYDNVSFSGRPLGFAVVEDDNMYLRSIASIANFYQNSVDSIPQRWGTIIPNSNGNGVRGLQYYDFYNGTALSAQYTDPDGTWCSGALTASPVNGTTGVYLNSTLNCTTGLAEANNAEGFLVVPNPSCGTVSVRADGALKAEAFNSIGEKIAERFFETNQQSLDLTFEQAGIYQVQITLADGKRLTKKLIVY